VARLSPLGFKRVNFLGRHSFTAPTLGPLRQLRALALTAGTTNGARWRRSHRANSRAAPNRARGGQAKEAPGLAEPQTG
jgi:hypothetical protein